MSTGLAVFDTTVQETNLWLKQLMEATLDANLAARSVLAVLPLRLDPGEVAKIKRILPHQLHALWSA